MNTDETTKTLSPLPCWRKIGQKMTQTLAILGVGIALSLESGTAQVITSPPTALQKKYNSTYGYTKYLQIQQYNIHILGTANVSDWFMRESYWMINNVMGAMLPKHRAKLSGFQALLVTDLDPDLTFQGGSVGSRNTGSNGWSCFTEDLVCTTYVDTYNPSVPSVYRGWETPVHEFGHAIEQTLGLTSVTRARHVANNVSIVGNDLWESFAWGMGDWFAVRPEYYRSRLPLWKLNYFAEVFDVYNVWSPSFAQRPTKQPVGPLGFTYGCGEGFGVKIGEKYDAAYGANGKFAYLTDRVGITFFNTSTFGYDPYYGVFKGGFYRLKSSIIPPAGYTLCANEGGSYKLPGLSSVAYGSNGNFKFFRGQTGTITFNSTAFSGDPNVGSLKNGFYKLGSSL